MKKNFILLILLLFHFNFLFSQEKKENKFKDFGVRFSGYVSYDAWYHTRQYVSARDGLVSLYPKNELLDANGEDINDESYLNAVSMKSRIRMNMGFIEVFGAKTSAVLEGDFTGTTNSNANGFRLRHAYTNFNWENKKLEISLGQRYHPFFILDAIPTVMALHTGLPVQLLNRTPQLRITKKFGKLKLITALITQRDFKSPGLDHAENKVIADVKFMQNAKIPNLFFQMSYHLENTLFGYALDYKILKPRLVTDKNLKTDETIKSFSSSVFFKTKFLENFTFKTKFILAQNLYEHLSLGGYAISSYDETTGKETYTPTNHANIWASLIYENKIRLGAFAGFMKNLGTSDNIINPQYENQVIFLSRGSDIEQLYKISGHISKKIKKVQLALEVERTTVAYGEIDYTNKGKIKNSKDISDYRFLFVAMYYF